MVMEILVDCSTCISVPTTRARLTIPKMSDGRALCLVLFIGVFTLTNTASVTEKRSHGLVSFALGQLSSRVDSLESSLKANLKNNQETKTDLEAEISSLKTQLEASVTNNLDTKTALEADIFNLKTKLAAKRCESGSDGFQPYKQATVTDANGKTRTHMKHVTFSSSFRSIPKVTAGITHIDADYRVNTRIHTDVLNQQASGFDLVVHDWADSVTYGVGIMWMACSN
ncbi:uncharacterized protein [Littorina saxatilis]|uniref:uncharacterized protein isoform X2 n=1 Tax=Littorina saxatilis TaxID=31220 RepID=UPI0038B60BA2